MRKVLLLTCLAMAVAVAGCGGGGGSTSGGIATRVSKLIDHTTGGSVTASCSTGDITVDVPAGALDIDRTISVTPTTSAPVALPFSNTYIVGAEFEPDGISFTSPVKITFPLGTTKPAGTKLLVLRYDSAHNPPVADVTATVNADTTTASCYVGHFTSYLLTGSSVVSATATNGPGMGFILSTGQTFDGAPVDFFYIGAGHSIQPNHSPMKTTTADYASITQATEGGYGLAATIPIQAGTVLLVKGQMPSDTHYYKMRITSVSDSEVTFVYQVIAAPPSITGDWHLSNGGTMSIMVNSVAPGYIADIKDSAGHYVQMVDSSILTGSVLSGTWVPVPSATGGPFTITFNAGFTSFTGSYSGTASGTWNGTK